MRGESHDIQYLCTWFAYIVRTLLSSALPEALCDTESMKRPKKKKEPLTRGLAPLLDHWRFVVFFAFVNIMVVLTLFSDRTLKVQFMFLVLEFLAIPLVFYLINVERRFWLLSFIIPAAGILFALLVFLFDIEGNPMGVFAVLQFIITLFLIATLIHYVIRERRIDFQTILAAASMYVLIGLLFARIYFMIDMFFGPMFNQLGRETLMSDYMYFSFITLTTTGFGDLTAASEFGRMVSVLEATFGQLYLVVVIAAIVGYFSEHLDERVKTLP